jgi:hypothetical protein
MLQIEIDKALVPEISMDDVAAGWVKQYKSDQKTALRNLINFVIRVSWIRVISIAFACIHCKILEFWLLNGCHC